MILLLPSLKLHLSQQQLLLLLHLHISLMQSLMVTHTIALRARSDRGSHVVGWHNNDAIAVSITLFERVFVRRKRDVNSMYIDRRSPNYPWDHVTRMRMQVCAPGCSSTSGSRRNYPTSIRLLFIAVLRLFCLCRHDTFDATELHHCVARMLTASHPQSTPFWQMVDDRVTHDVIAAFPVLLWVLCSSRLPLHGLHAYSCVRMNKDWLYRTACWR